MDNQIDAIDIIIIKFLGRNARITNTEIAERLNISGAIFNATVESSMCKNRLLNVLITP